MAKTVEELKGSRDAKNGHTVDGQHWKRLKQITFQG